MSDPLRSESVVLWKEAAASLAVRPSPQKLRLSCQPWTGSAATSFMMVAVDVDVAGEYRQHVGALAHYAAVLVGPADAMDVVNEAVATTLARGSLARVDDVRAYWFRAVSFTAAGWHRSHGRRVAREHRVHAATPAVVDTPELDEALAAIAPLSVQQRAVVYLTYWADWDVPRIAEALGVGEGTIRKQLGRARAHLREVLDHD